MNLIRPLATRALPLMALAAALGVQAQELRLQCYCDGNECAVTGEIVKRFEAANPAPRSSSTSRLTRPWALDDRRLQDRGDESSTCRRSVAIAQ